MKKKMMTAVLAMTMVATAVAGCGSSSGSGTTVELTNEAGGDAQAEIQKAEADQTAAEGTVYKVGIVQYVDDTTAGRVGLGPGTLYTILAKFEEEGLIRETAVEGRKRTYAITDRGRALYRQELSRLRLCVADGEREEC